MMPFAAVWALAALSWYISRHSTVLALPEAVQSLAWLYRAAWGGPGLFLAALPGHAGAGAGALLLLAASWLNGLRALEWLAPAGAARGRNLERHLQALGLGLGGAALLVLGCGLCGLMYPAALAAGFGILGIMTAPRGAFAPARRRWKGLHPLWLAALIPLGLDAASCFSPEWFYDARVYHLGLPERFLMERKFPVMPGNMLTFLPMNCEMIYAAAMDLGGEECARIMNACFGGMLALATAFLAGAISGPRPVKWVGALAAAILAGMPLIMVENGSAFADNLRAFWEIMALAILVRRNGRLPAAGAFLGLALGAKYLAGISFVYGAGAVLAARIRGAITRRKAAAFLLLGALAASPWLGRNWLAGRDPVYPLGARAFNSLGFSERLLARWEADNRHYGVKDMNLVRWLTLPYRLVMNVKEGEFGTFTTGPLPLALAPLLLAFRRWRGAGGLALGFLAFHFLAWSATSHMVRYLLPGLAVMSALLAWVCAESAKGVSYRYARILVGAAVLWSAFSVVQRAHYFYGLENLYGTFSQASGREGRNGWLARRGYGRALAALPPGKVLLVGEECVLGLGRPWKGGSIYDVPPLEEWARASADERRFSVKIRQSGIESVLLNGDSLTLRMDRGDFRLDEREWGVLNGWWKSLRVVFRNPPRVGFVPGRPGAGQEGAGLPVRSEGP